MTFTQDEYAVVNSNTIDIGNETFAKDKQLGVNTSNPFLGHDLAIIINTYEKDCQAWAEEDYTKAYIYRDVYGTDNFSRRVREQLDYYPGMHQSSSPPEQDPLYTNAKDMSEDRLNYWNNAMDNPDAFMSGLNSRQGDFDYSGIFGADSNAKTRSENIRKMLLQCIPCFDRLVDMDSLLPDGDLLEIHLMNIKVRTDILSQFKELFDNPGYFIDICELLKLFSHLCPQDLLAILALLTQYLAKINLEVQFNLDFMLQFIGPMLSPFLDAIAEWLDKWIQLILNPLICVLDHINETIITVQNAKIPFSEVGANVGLNVNAAMPGHLNAANSSNIGGKVGFGDSDKAIYENGADPYAGAWGSEQIEAFETPDSAKYNPAVPSFPTEETEMAGDEILEAWSPSMSIEEREEKNKRWAELREENYSKRASAPPPLSKETHNGTRWSKDDVPNSEKFTKGGSFDVGKLPPEKQTSQKKPTEYFVSSRITNTIIEVRNIMQGAIQYIKDWFTYITQMIYDLLGVDIGWMSKKTGTTLLKSKLIQLIYIIKSIIEAVSKNGLQCGTHTNLDEPQMKYILENNLNKFVGSGKKFDIAPDGTIKLKSTTSDININKSTKSKPESSVTTTPDDKITINTNEQDSDDSYTVVRNCFKSVSKEELENVKKWITDFENRGLANANT